MAGEWTELRAALAADRQVNTRNSRPIVTLAIWRLGHLGHVRRDPLGFVLRRVHGVLDVVWTRGYVGAELPRHVPVGPGLRLPHGGRGLVVHHASRIGAGVTIYHQVTLGIRGTAVAPTIEDGAYLGAGAKILGGITLGAGCAIGANAVVLSDVPAGETWVGVPARSAGPPAAGKAAAGKPAAVRAAR